MTSDLPKYVSWELVKERLPLIFPEGTPNRNYCTRDLATSTIFTMLYIGAIESAEVYMGPIHVYRMTEEQSLKQSDTSRVQYRKISSNVPIKGKRWYADNTRESIRDETLRDGLLLVGAVKSLVLPTTSGKPRYYLEKGFSALFNPDLTGKKFQKQIEKWQEDNLSKQALARISLASLSAHSTKEKIFVTFPNRETRYLAPGPSGEISKAVIEIFSEKFLNDPGVLWLSESGNKVVMRDDILAKSIGINIEKALDLPDIILVDLNNGKPLLIFVEVVATDGAITERRQDAIYKLTNGAGIKKENVLFLSAFNDRESPGSKKSLFKLAWNSFAWFVSEPSKIMILKDGAYKLSKLSTIFKS